MSFVFDKLGKICERLEELKAIELSKIENIEYQKCDYKVGHTPPESGWQPHPKGTHLAGIDSHYWLHFNFSTPKAESKSYYALEMTTGSEGEWDAINAQGLIYLNGEMKGGLDPNHIYIYLDADTSYDAYNYFYLGMVEESVEIKGRVLKIDERVEKLYYDISVPYDCLKLLDKESEDYIKIIYALEQAANLIDFRVPYSKGFYESVENAIEFMDKEFYGKVCTTEGKPIINCIGHTHIDVEWLWTRAQTREKIQRSFANAEPLMDKYPEFKFMLSQPELYRYLKEEAPDKYEHLKELVKNGRWEPEGAMYVEADCNLINGESMVRQILLGKQFFKKEFGVDCKVLFLPDVFGYSAAMPQVLKKSGLKHFVTSKISWNESNTMPYDTFYWQGIDGTEIFTNFITAQNYDPSGKTNFTTYNGMLNPSEILGARHRSHPKNYTNRALTTFGYGDGGGGPTAKMLETQRRLQKGIPGMPITEIKFLAHYLDALKEEFDASCETLKKTPRWVGELYLELHRGTYTSIAKNKRNNRLSEIALKNTETLGAITEALGNEYPTEMLDKYWHKVLHNQFHDIIPGSSIFEVYEGTDKDYKEVLSVLNEFNQSSIKLIADNVNAKGTLVFNPVPFRQGVLTKINGKTFESQEKVPALGWCVIDTEKNDCGVTVNGNTAENKYYKLELHPSGRIASLYDKAAERELFKVGEYGNEFRVFEDIPREYDAWEISDYHKQKMWVIDGTAKLEPIFDGSRAGFRVTKEYLESKISQNIWLYTECRRIDFETEIDWKQSLQLLKTSFPFDIHATKADYEIQFGYLSRPTHFNTGWDAAKFEVCGHKWADISDGDYGVALLNDSKYGHSTEGSNLSLTLIKSALYPNPKADKEVHRFTYSLLPHSGSFKEGGVVKEAERLNNPQLSVAVSGGEGSIPASCSYISANQDNIVISAIKKAENGKGSIVRLYDAHDCRRKVTISLPKGTKKAYLCDLMENREKELKVENGAVTLTVSNFEIITLNII